MADTHEIRWTRVRDRLPRDSQQVMVTGPSGYVPPYDHFLCLAHLDRLHRPWDEGERPRWLGVDSESLVDQGWEPTHWSSDTPELPRREKRLSPEQIGLVKRGQALAAHYPTCGHELFVGRLPMSPVELQAEIIRTRCPVDHSHKIMMGTLP